MKFTDIAQRKNGPDQRIDMDWFNSLRAAGMALEALFGPTFTSSAAVAIANNQGAPADVTGLLLDKTAYKSALLSVEIRRITDETEAVAVGRITAVYRDLASAWELTPTLDGDGPGDGAGVTFSMNGEQVRYTSSDLAGANYAGTLKFKLMTFGV